MPIRSENQCTHVRTFSRILSLVASYNGCDPNPFPIPRVNQSNGPLPCSMGVCSICPSATSKAYFANFVLSLAPNLLSPCYQVKWRLSAFCIPLWVIEVEAEWWHNYDCT